MAEEAGYQSLYRKYRPQAPDEVVGQDHVVRALVGAIREDRLSHAFLFCGPRGTGKTSTARILAKMINCERGPTPDPCGTCEQCLRIRDGSHLDVVEIDAASHGGVDDARELRERAPTAPAMGREKVYIIDEAQRLSREAFDALLKVFEEPPAGVRFVLATTEPHKMPPTIVGRCQRFDFRRIPTEQMVDLLQRVAKQEGVELTLSAAEAIARQAEGSARDAESLLDQSMVLADGEVTEQTVASLIGAPREDAQFELVDALAVGDVSGVFATVDRLVQEGNDIRHLTAQVLAHVRDLLLVRSAPEEPAVLDVGPDLHARLSAQASKLTPAELSRVLSLLVAAQTDMRWTTSPRLTLELALVRAAMPQADDGPAALLARIERLERLAGVDAGPNAGHATTASEASPIPRPGSGASPRPSTPPANAPADEAPARADARASAGAGAVAHAPSAGALDLATIRRSWPRLLEHLGSRRQMILQANLQSVTAAGYDGVVLELAFPPGRKFAVEKVQSKEAELREAFTELFGVGPRIRCVAREEAGGGSWADDDPPATREEALERFKTELGAQLEEDGPAP